MTTQWPRLNANMQSSHWDKGTSIKRKLKSEMERKNSAFHDAIQKAVHGQPFAQEVGDWALFETDGNLIENDWSNNDADYRNKIEEIVGRIYGANNDSESR